jgi:hypothetical protein
MSDKEKDKGNVIFDKTELDKELKKLRISTKKIKGKIVIGEVMHCYAAGPAKDDTGSKIKDVEPTCYIMPPVISDNSNDNPNKKGDMIKRKKRLKELKQKRTEADTDNSDTE